MQNKDHDKSRRWVISINSATYISLYLFPSFKLNKSFHLILMMSCSHLKPYIILYHSTSRPLPHPSYFLSIHHYSLFCVMLPWRRWVPLLLLFFPVFYPPPKSFLLIFSFFLVLLLFPPPFLSPLYPLVLSDFVRQTPVTVTSSFLWCDTSLKA